MENNRILVIDDEAKVHDIFKGILTGSSSVKEESLNQEASILFGTKTSSSPSRLKKQFQVSFASQGEEGLELIKESLSDADPFTVAFIDVRMPPGWDGIKTAAEIRKLDPNIELVIVTAYADKSLDEIVESIGMPERLLYLKKPFVQDEIWQLANALSAKWNLQKNEQLYRRTLEKWNEEFEKWNEDLEQKIKERTRDLELANQKLKEMQSQVIQIANISALGQLGAGVAHEINNPLTGIIGYAQFMLSKIEQVTQNKDELKRNLDFIEKEARRCKAITETLLKFTTRASHQFEQVVLNNIISETMQLLQNHLKLHNIILSCDLPAEPISVLGSAFGLQQALINIIFNSQQAMPEGGQLRIWLAMNPLKKAEIKIIDSGIGIPEENLAHIFEPFFTTKQDWRCIGLGLTMVYQIIHDHKGDIRVESKPGRGTTVIITLPLI
jgi:C4-dicarboxylate-specific signal transduction histidine kinase